MRRTAERQTVVTSCSWCNVRHFPSECPQLGRRLEELTRTRDNADRQINDLRNYLDRVESGLVHEELRR
jgi:hypothetical protein